MNLNISSSKLQARLNKADKELPKQIDRALQIIASEGARNIEERGQKGKGYKGSFIPYSASYAKAKRNGWRATSKREGFSGDPSGVVNLTLHGRMWAGLTSKLAKKGMAEIYFSTADANKKAYFNNKKRPFFGFSNKDRIAFVKFFEKQIKI